MNQKMLVSEPSGLYKLRIFKNKGRRKVGPSVLAKCGCCNHSVRIYHSPEDLEINGVLASIEEWKSLLLPLLQIEK